MMSKRKIASVSLVPMIVVLALIFLAAPSSIATAQTPGTPVPASELVPTASAVANLTLLAQQQASNPGLTQQPQAVPRALPSGQDLSAAAGSSYTQAATNQLTSPAPSLSFEALGDNGSTIPAGVSGAVGSNYVLTALNSEIRIQNRVGAIISSVSTNRFWAAVLPAGSTGVFDLRAVYDPARQRWILAAASDAANANSSIDVAVSATSDPTGYWYLFRYDGDAQNLLWADYPMLGFDKDWVVVSANMFTIASDSFVQGQVYALNKANLYANSGAGSAVFVGKNIPFSLQPAETTDNTLGIEYLVRHVSSANGTEAKSTLAGVPASLPTLTIDTATLTSNLGGWTVPSGISLPQSGSSTGLDAGDARVQQVVARTVNGQTSIWFVQAIALPPGGAPAHSAVQWWQVDGSSAFSTTIFQQGRIEDPTATSTNGGLDFAYPSLAVNRENDVLIGYSLFSSSGFPSAGYSFRAASDAPNTMRAPSLLKAGLGAYVKTLGGSLNRWGDFSHTVVDPADATSLWTIQAYADTPVGTGDGSGRWATWWGLVQPSGTASGTVLPAATCYTLATGASPDSSGSIGSSPAPNCNNGTQYVAGTNVTLTAYAADGYSFDSWSGDASGNSNPVTITMDGNKNVTANFVTSTSSSAFGKSSPSNGATGQGIALTLHWNGSSGASSYVYCLDTNDNSACDNSWANVGDNTSVDVSGLSASTTYYWQVRALDGDGNIIARADDSTWWNFTTAGASPGSFGKSSPANGLTGEPVNLTLSWGASSGATDYQYCVDTNNNNSCDGSWTDVGANTSAALNGLSFITTYYWQVRAVNSTGTTTADGGAWWSFITRALIPVANDDFGSATPIKTARFSTSEDTRDATTAVDDPAFACTGTQGAASVWFVSTPATNGILVATTRGSTYDTIMAVWQGTRGSLTNVACNDNRGAGKTSALLVGLTGGTTYYLEVAGHNGGGGLVLNVGFVKTVLPAVNLLSLPNGSHSTTPSQVLDWTDSSGATSYNLQVHKGSPGGAEVISAQPTVSTYTTGALDPARYFWQVQACNSDGCSAWSATWSFVVDGSVKPVQPQSPKPVQPQPPKPAKPARPTLLGPANGSKGSGQATLDWTDSAGATYYQVQVARNSQSGPVVGSLSPSNSEVTTPGLASKHWYYWRVQACNANGCSAWTGWWRFLISK